MLLNLFQILVNAGIPHRTLYVKDAEVLDISRIRLISKSSRECGPSPEGFDTLCIIDDLSLLDMVPADSHILILYKNEQEYFNASLDNNAQRITTEDRRSVSAITGCDADQARDRIQSVLDLFEDRDSSIKEAILDARPATDVFRLCAKVAGLPLALFDRHYSPIMHAELDNTDETGHLWDFVSHHFQLISDREGSPDAGGSGGTSQTDGSSDASSLTDEGSEMSRYISIPYNAGSLGVLISPVYKGSSLFGYIVMANVGAPDFEPFRSELATSALLRKYIKYLLEHADEFSAPSGHTPWFIQHLLKGEKLSPEIYAYNLPKYGLKKGTPFFIWNFSYSGNVNEFEPMEAITTIGYLIPSSVIFKYNNQILAIDTELSDNTDEFIKGLASFMKGADLQCGISMVFDNPIELHTAYLQSNIALEYAGRNGCMRFTGCIMDYMLHGIEGQIAHRGFMYPGLIVLLARDPEYGKELLACLETYLLCGCNVSRAAEKLFIHRHTMIYRLDYIKQVLPIDFEALSNDEILLLAVSCRKLRTQPKSANVLPK